jgi:hypothetical protein
MAAALEKRGPYLQILDGVSDCLQEDEQRCFLCQKTIDKELIVISQKCHHVFHSTCLDYYIVGDKPFIDIQRCYFYNLPIKYKCPKCHEDNESLWINEKEKI